MARKLAPSLVIIEDIDTVELCPEESQITQSWVSIYNLWMEWKQAMGICRPLRQQTTQKTSTLQFPTGLEGSTESSKFHYLTRTKGNRLFEPSEDYSKQKIPNKALVSICSRSSGLSGAWIKELVQTSFIETVSNGREKITLEDLEYGLQDVLGRRGMAYIPTMTLNNTKSDNSSVYVA